MMLKIALFVSVLLLVEAAEVQIPAKPILLKTIHADYFDRIREVSDVDINTNVEGSAVVLKSNMPPAMQARFASTLTSIYQQTSDPLQRAQKFQTAAAQIYNADSYWNVVIDFNVITFYSQYYILLQIDNDRVLAFGLN